MRAFVLALLFAVATTGASARTLERLQLVWKPTSELKLGTTQMTDAPIQFGAFVDARDNKAAIGENVEDDKPKPVTTTDDVGAFVGRHMRELFDRAGLKTVENDGKVTVTGEVTQFFCREGSTYKAMVAVRIKVTDASGQSLWHGLAAGDATRFGRSFQAENYYETLSDAVVNTVSSMLGSEEFQKALAGTR